MARRPEEPMDDRCVCEIVEALKSDNLDVQALGLRKLKAKFAYWLRGEILDMLERRGISEHYAGDLLETTIASIVKKIHNFDHVKSPPAKFPVWMGYFAYNRVRNLYRRLHPKGEHPNTGDQATVISLDQLGEQWDFYESISMVNALTVDSTTGSPEAIFEAAELHKYFLFLHEETLNRLRPVHQAVLTQHHLEGLSLREVAEQTHYAYPYLRNQSKPSRKEYWAALLNLLVEQEISEPSKLEYIQHIRQLIVAYGDSDE